MELGWETCKCLFAGQETGLGRAPPGTRPCGCLLPAGDGGREEPSRLRGASSGREESQGVERSRGAGLGGGGKPWVSWPRAVCE